MFLFDFLIATLFFLAIIGILLNCSSYFNLFIPPIFSYISRSNRNRNQHLSKLFQAICHLRPSGILVSICSNIFYITNIIIFLSLRLLRKLYLYAYIFVIVGKLNRYIHHINIQNYSAELVLIPLKYCFWYCIP